MCLEITVRVTLLSYFVLNCWPQYHQRGQGNKQKSQRSKKGLYKFVIFQYVSRIKKKVSDSRNVRGRK